MIIRRISVAMAMAVTLLYLSGFLTHSVNAVADESKLYQWDNVLAAGNFNDGTSSSDISLMIRIEAGNDIVVDEGDEVKYIVPLADEDHSEDWITIKFDDSKWEDGISGVGYSDGDDNTVVPSGNVASIYTRYYFDVPKASSVKQIKVLVDYDDGYILWLNGVEIARSATMAPVSDVGDIPAWDVSAARSVMGHHGASELAAGEPNEARWDLGIIVIHDIDVGFGGQSVLSVESQGKLATLWGGLKQD